MNNCQAYLDLNLKIKPARVAYALLVHFFCQENVIGVAGGNAAVLMAFKGALSRRKLPLYSHKSD